MSLNLGNMLKALMSNGGSDLHIVSGTTPMLRIHGVMVPIQSPPSTPEEVDEVVQKLVSEKQTKELIKNKAIDFSFLAHGIGTFRVNIFYQRNGLSLAIRRLPEKAPTLDELQLPEILKSVSQYSNGLILVTGPTGSGKSTTLAAMVDELNSHIRGHILTLEDPIEFRHEPKNSMINQRALGDHFNNFATALKNALREDPDVILVGEMRDHETIKLALEAAETGHLVLGTLHTNSAPKAIDRMVNVFSSDEQNQIRLTLSETLKMIVSQKLVLGSDEQSRLCFMDILINNPAIANLIRENKTHQIYSAMQTGKNIGMQVLDQELILAYKNGDISFDSAVENANDKDFIKKMLQNKTPATPNRIPESA